jgi:hypothetical protein
MLLEANNGGWTDTVGSWSQSQLSNALFTRYTSTNGNATQISVTGTSITVGYISRFGLGDGGTLTVKVDGNTQGTIDTSFGTASNFNNGGAGAARYVPMAIRYTGFSAGSHTVNISLTSATNTIGQIVFVCGNFEGAGPSVYLCGPYKLANYNVSPPYNNGSDAAVDAYLAAVKAIRDEAVADGRNVFFCNTMEYFLVASNIDSDQIHPNNAGHAHIRDAFLAAENFPPWPGAPMSDAGNVLTRL